MVAINSARLLDNLATLRSFGATGNGVVRPSLSDTDLGAREWLRGKMVEAGLDATIDGVGNVFGRSRNPGSAIVLGSHTDTQPEGGWLDGAMGVIDALEVAQALGEHPDTSHLAVDVASWIDEEGTYGSFLGSRSFVGELTDADFVAENAQGESFAQALSRAGLAGRERVTLDRPRQIAYLEAHIEQGPRLEDEQLRLGVVTGIVGIRTIRFTFHGQQNHAGTTPMNRRKDAAAAMFRFGTMVNDRMPEVAGELSVWTIGDVAVYPGSQSVVPGRADVVIQFRDSETDVLDRMQTLIFQSADEAVLSSNGPLDFSYAMLADVPAAKMDDIIVDAIAAAAAAVAPRGWMWMPSAAAHDAQVIAPHLPSGMLFIPSLGGISHDFSEDSDTADIVIGAQALADATVGVLRRL